nr:uncharacterized protein LOC109171500 [Ipomoea batatas]
MFQDGEVISNMRCHCGQVLKLRTSWTNDNPGRRSKAIIPGLLRRINRNDEEIRLLKSRLKATAEQDDLYLQGKSKCCCPLVMVFVVVVAVLVMMFFNSNVKTIGGEKLVERLPLAL